MKVVAGTDFSSASQEMLRILKEHLWPAGTQVRLIHVIDLIPFAPAFAVLEESKRAASTSLAAAAASLRRPGLEVETEILIDSPRNAIVKYAENWGADLIVLGSRGQGKFVRILLGSTVQGVLRQASCSVEILRPSHDAPGVMQEMRVLLATDGSACSEAAIKSIAARPWPDRTRFRVIGVVPDTFPDGCSSFAPPPQLAADLDAFREENRRRTAIAIMTARASLGEFGVQPVDEAETVCGDPRQEILAEAERWHADLVALGSHGRRGAARFLLGSVSEFVAEHARCSVVVIRKRMSTSGA